MADSLRIRFDGNRHREDSIEKAARFYDVNKSDAVAYACEDAVEIIRAVKQVLERDDLTLQQRHEIAETLSTRSTEFDVQLNVLQE
ncbi:hypothetical protein ACKVMT_13880 [Halobacteriales archaeon Cl-PHB]